MGPTDPRVLMDLFHGLGDRIRRTVAEGNELVKGAKWLQSQIGEQVSQTEHSARNGLDVSQVDFAKAKESAAAVERVRGDYADAVEQVRSVSEFVTDVTQRAAVARAHWQNQVAAATQDVQTAGAYLRDARARLAECRQPVYRLGPQGQPVIMYRDCSGCLNAVALAERAFDIARASLEACRASLERAVGAERLVATARPHLFIAEAEIQTAGEAVATARDHALDSEKAAEAELAVGGEAVQRAGAAAKVLHQAEGHLHQSLRTFADGENVARTADQDLNKRIDSLQLFDRPHPLP